jgi:hypothetical protein
MKKSIDTILEAVAADNTTSETEEQAQNNLMAALGDIVTKSGDIEMLAELIEAYVVEAICNEYDKIKRRVA